MSEDTRGPYTASFSATRLHGRIYVYAQHVVVGRTPADILLCRLQFTHHIHGCGVRQGGTANVLVDWAQMPYYSRNHHHQIGCFLREVQACETRGCGACLWSQRSAAQLHTYVLLYVVVTARCCHPIAKQIVQGAKYTRRGAVCVGSLPERRPCLPECGI